MRKNIVKVTTVTETRVHQDTLRRALKLPKWGALDLLDKNGQVVSCVVDWTGGDGPRIIIRNTRIVRR